MKLSLIGVISAHKRFAVCLVLCLALLASCDRAHKDPPAAPPDVSILRAHAQDVEVVESAPARTNAFRIAEIRPQVSGVILRRMFRRAATFAKASSCIKSIRHCTRQRWIGRRARSRNSRPRSSPPRPGSIVTSR